MSADWCLICMTESLNSNLSLRSFTDCQMGFSLHSLPQQEAISIYPFFAGYNNSSLIKFLTSLKYKGRLGHFLWLWLHIEPKNAEVSKATFGLECKGLTAKSGVWGCNVLPLWKNACPNRICLGASREQCNIQAMKLKSFQRALVMADYVSVNTGKEW